MHSAVLWCGVPSSVCLSVCLSVTLVYCVETTELIIKQLALDCSLGTLVYGHWTWNIYICGIPRWGVNMGVEKSWYHTNMMIYLTNHRTLIRTCIRPTHWYYFQCPCATLTWPRDIERRTVSPRQLSFLFVRLASKIAGSVSKFSRIRRNLQ